ncbi:MAG: 50S ribosomal protein L4 [Candidatus Vogelbacteria bacterium]|nr:50S ribosomal protein L4 [Candidatus Vogelbacteria bacterium]
MQTKLYNQEGKELSDITLPEKIFGVKWNADLVNQVITSMRSNQREGNAHAKNRGEVSGGGKKPWKQKGTGRARHGSTRSPIWRHGGVTHGPRNDKDYTKIINKKMKAKALYSILSAKLRDGEILFVDGINLKESKTKHASSIVKSISGISGFNKIAYKSGRRALISLPEKNDGVYKSFRNLSTVSVDEFRNINPVDALAYQYLVIVDPNRSISQIENKI